MQSESYNLTSNATLTLIDSRDNNNQEGIVSLFIEGVMLLLFVLSAIYGVFKIKRGNRIDLKDVESVLRNATEQQQLENLPLKHDNRICNSTSK